MIAPDSRIKAPRKDCPKCGDPDGFTGAKPTYVALQEIEREWDVPGSKDSWIPEHMDWYCRTCGYTIEGPVK